MPTSFTSANENCSILCLNLGPFFDLALEPKLSLV